jgi:hypothetical protein
MAPIGVGGLYQSAGYIYEDRTSQGAFSGQQWAKIVKQMTDESAVIGGILLAVETLIRQVPWHMEPADETPEADALATFVLDCLHDMSNTWSDTLSEILTMIPYGYAYLEQVYKIRGGTTDDPTRRSKFDDGRIGWRKWFSLAPETVLHWTFDTEGGIQGLVQLAPPLFAVTYVPIDKALLFRTTTRKNNPEGRSMLRNAWRSWVFGRNIEQIEAIGVERDLAGLPVVYVPPSVLDTTGPDPNGRNAVMRAAMTTLVQGLKRGEREGVVFPRQYDDHGNLLYELSLLSTGGTRQFDTDRIITRYEARQAMAILGDFVMIGHEATGTQALIRDKSELFRDSLGCILDMICGIINSHAIPRLLRLNGDDVSLAPKLAHESVRQIDLGALTGLVTAFNKTTTGPFADPNSEASRFVLGQAGLPVPEDVADTQDALDEQADQPNDTDEAGSDDAEDDEIAI